MPVLPDRVFRWFSLLRRPDVEQTSNEDIFYNCIAHAVGEDDSWWAPSKGAGYYWPRTAPMEFTLAAYQAAFGTRGYSACDTENLEDGFEKIAIFVNEHGKPTHAARQLPDGFWTSKLGIHEDVRHVLRQLEGPDPAYGRVAAFMKRRLPNPTTPPLAGR
jgi:hypothetical protein